MRTIRANVNVVNPVKCGVAMLRGRLVVLGLLLLATAVSFCIYQYSDSSVVHTRIIPSRTLQKDARRYSAGGWEGKEQVESDDDNPNDEGSNGVRMKDEESTATHLDDAELARENLEGVQELEKLGNSELAVRLRHQALTNQQEAVRLREQQKKIDSELFNIKVEKGRQAGLEVKLAAREQDLKNKQKAMEEERTRLSEERIYGRPGVKPDCLNNEQIKRLESKPSSPSQPAQKPASENYSNANKKLPQKMQRNPLSVQGSNLKNYLKEMNKNFYKQRGVNETEYAKEKPVYVQEMKKLVAKSNPSETNNNNNDTLQYGPDNSEKDFSKSDNPVLKSLKKLDKSALAKLPMIERLVEQGHFGYEHGRNGKGASHERKSDLPATAQTAADRNKTKQGLTAKPPTPDPKSDRGWINNDQDDIWEGQNPQKVARLHPGIMLDGSYMLRPFIDPSDVRATGMEGNPQNIDDMSEGAAEERFYQLVTGDQMHCADIQRLGNYGDGGWDMCASGPYKPKHNCLVYSFGINNDFSFDDGISNKYGCEVKAFDPSMNVGDHMHSSKVHFFNLGLGATDGINSQAWQLRTFGSILKRLGHDTRVIDFLKIDIEFNEWACFKTMLKERSLKNVKQLVFEIHTSEVYTINKQSRKENFLEWYNSLLGLEKQGFRRYHHHYNPNGQYTSSRTGKERTCCYELYYVNIRFLKKHEASVG